MCIKWNHHAYITLIKERLQNPEKGEESKCSDSWLCCPGREECVETNSQVTHGSPKEMVEQEGSVVSSSAFSDLSFPS